MNEVGLVTLLCQVEAMVNERPLITIVENDIVKTITPSVLLNGRSLSHIYDEGYELAPTKRLKFLDLLEKQFWDTWQKQYLPLLMERSKWTHASKNSIKIGSVVMLLKENHKRHTWPMARVIDTIKGRDGAIRSLKIIVDGKEMARPTQHVVLVKNDNCHLAGECWEMRKMA